MKIEKYIKTECGRNRYHNLKKDYNKNIFRNGIFDLQVIGTLGGLLLLFVFIQYWYLFVGAMIIGTVYCIVKDEN